MSPMEKAFTENYIINKLKEKDWKHFPADELERSSYEDPLLTPNLRRAIRRIN